MTESPSTTAFVDRVMHWRWPRAILHLPLGLLDARVICGDAKVAAPMLEGAHDRWVKQKPPWLRVLGDLVAERHRSFGDVGFLLEPDLKEAHGGLRERRRCSVP